MKEERDGSIRPERSVKDVLGGVEEGGVHGGVDGMEGEGKVERMRKCWRVYISPLKGRRVMGGASK